MLHLGALFADCMRNGAVPLDDSQRPIETGDTPSLQQTLQQPLAGDKGSPDPVCLIVSETLPPASSQDEPEETSVKGLSECLDTLHLVESPQPPPPPPDAPGENQEVSSPISCLVFPESYASRSYTRDSLTKLERRYFDDSYASSSAAEKQAVLDRFDLCHQAGFKGYDDVTAFVEGRVTLEELVRDREETAEMRRKQCERQQRLEERMEAHRAAQMELQSCEHSQSTSLIMLCHAVA